MMPHGPKTFLSLLDDMHKDTRSQNFDKCLHFDVQITRLRKPDVHFCSGQRWPQFDHNHLRFSNKLPECADFGCFQVIYLYIYPLMQLLGPMDTMGPRTWPLLYLEIEKEQARFSNLKAVDTYVIAPVRRKISERLLGAL